MAFATKLEILIFLSFVSVSFCKFCSLEFQNCNDGPTIGHIKSVEINETCTKDKEAVLKKNTTVQINFTFSADEPESELTSVVAGRLPNIPIFISFPLGNPNACKDSGLKCPIKEKVFYNYLPLLKILPEFPAIKAEVRWKLQDKDGKDIFCVLMPAEIIQ